MTTPRPQEQPLTPYRKIDIPMSNIRETERGKHRDLAERMAVVWFDQPVKLVGEYAEANDYGMVDVRFEFEPVPYSSVEASS